jgi:hypothetical protein
MDLPSSVSSNVLALVLGGSINSLSPWAAQRSDGHAAKAFVEGLPHDCILEILYCLDVIDIVRTLQVRLIPWSWTHLLILCLKTCRRLHALSDEHSLWLAAFHRESFFLPLPPCLDRPLELYSTQELRRLVVRSTSLERNWTNDHPKIRSTRTVQLGSLPSDPDPVTSWTIIPGHRWLLALTKRGNVLYWDLEDEHPTRHHLIQHDDKDRLDRY